MPKNKKVATKSTKHKLTPEERSAVAKARWAKRRVNFNDAMDKVLVEKEEQLDTIQAGSPPPVAPGLPVIPQNPTPEQPPVAPESILGVIDERIAQSRQDMEDRLLSKNLAPAPQLTPTMPKKQKRYTGPKEFSVALKAAENRLAKAIVERAEYGGKMAALQAEIPSLVQIINALKGPQNISVAPYDFAATGMPGSSYPSAPPFQPYVDPLAAIQGAAAAPPVSRAQGGAIQFSPEVLGSLEGPDDDDDPDKYITGPLAGGGWK